MTIPKTYRKSRDPILANFDWTDIAAGTGYEDYFLIESEDSGDKDHHLTSQHDYSNSVFIQASNSTSDLDYDLTPFVFPRTLNGTVLISLPLWAAGEVTPVFTAELYRWDGSTETQIGSTITYAPNLLATTPIMIYLRMPIVNALIPAGETLRFRLVMANAIPTATRYGQDPANRTDASLTITTTSKISIPYRLNL